MLAALKALLFGNLASIAIQLGSVPIFLNQWGISKYGEWLILYAIPGYLAVSDFGMIAVATNKVDALCQRNKYRSANRTFATSIVLLTLFCLASVSALVLLAWGFSSKVFSLFPSTPKTTVVLVATILCADAIASIIFNHCAGLFRSVRRYDLSLYWQNTGRLATGIGVVATVATGGGFVASAVTLLLVRTAVFALMLRQALPMLYWLKKSAMKFNAAEMRSLTRLAGTYVILPVSNMLYLHVSIVILGIFTSPAVVASFSILRTYTRLIPQFVSIAGKAVWAENSRAAAAGDFSSVRKMMKAVSIYTVLLGTLCVLAFLAVGQWVFEYWTGGRSEFNKALYFAMLAHAFFIATYTAMEVFVLSTNSHSRYAFFFLLMSLFQVVLATLFLKDLGALAFPVFGAVASAITTIYVTAAAAIGLHKMKPAMSNE